MNAKVFIVFVAVAFALFADCAQSHKVPKVSRCNHDEKMAEMKRLGTRALRELPQKYFDEDNKTKIGSIRFGTEERIGVNDILGSTPMACSKVGQVLRINSKDYDCTADDILDDDKRTFIQWDIMRKVEEFIGDLVKIVQIDDGVLIANGRYGLVDMDDIQFPDYDVALCVTYRPDSLDVIGSGMSVATDQKGRPVLGHINWNPKTIDPKGDKQMYYNIALHSLLHVLGFNQERMLDFRNISTATNESDYIEPYHDLQIIGKTSDYREQTLLTSPKVTQLFREQFACEDAEGAVLEDQGGSDVAGSHWEMAVMMDELMTASVSSHSVLSALTLAVLEDSGWYLDVNYDKAERLLFGEKKGCDFVRNRCNSSWPKGEGYFCDSQGEESCTYDRKAIGWCDLRSWAVIPEKYQYFNSSYVGGPIDYADYCPFTYPIFYCDQSATSGSSEHGDAYGSSSRCFKSTLTNSLEDGEPVQKALCYPHHCYSANEYAVQIGSSYWYPCPSGKDLKEIIGYNGTLQCPDASLFCSSSSVDKKFPVFTKIEPTSAEPGATVQIYGKNLNSETVVTLGIACENVTYQSKTDSITCIIKKYSQLSIVPGKKNIILKQNGYSLAVPNAFELKGSLTSWIVTNWFFSVCIGLAALVILLTLILVICKCCTTSRKWKKYQQSKKSAADRQNAAAHNASASRNEFAGDVDLDTMA